MAKKQLKTIFLKEFVRRLIMHYVPPEEPMQRSPRVAEPSTVAPRPTPRAPISPLTKIRALLLDPTIYSIECPGPDKQIIVNKNSHIQPVNLSLDASEINRIMGEFSEKTKIPLIKGIFKAALGNLLVTAVISDFVGTRFIIQKRTI